MSGFIQEGDMVRLNAIQRAQSIPESITPYCTDTDQLDMAARYRVIISTCSTAGQLYSLGLRAGHITHVFVDEVCNLCQTNRGIFTYYILVCDVAENSDRFPERSVTQ